MRSTAAEVDAYLAAVPEDRRAVLSAVRDACRVLLAGFEEAMRYGMPGYLRDGVVEVGWASQKRYLALYVLRTDVIVAHQEQLAGLDVGKGAVRYRRTGQVDLDVVRSLLRMTAASRGPVC